MSNMCLVVTPAIEELASKIQQEYPEACQRNGFNNQMCAEWIGLYNNTNSKNPDSVPTTKSLVNFIEKLRNQEGKSFLRDLDEERRQYAIEQEMQEIKAKALADDTFMKAPNGKDTNLTERQWLQVRTKNFINWFGDWINDPANASKVVDENGEPLVVYHFTKDSIFTTYKENPKGLHFTADPEGKFIFYPNENTLKEKHSVFLNIRKPGYELYDKYFTQKQGLRLKEIDSISKKLPVEDRNPLIKEAARIRQQGINRFLGEEDKAIEALKNKDSNVDGVIRDYAKTFADYIALNPNQIKSATDNNGMFSTENDNILASPAQYEEIPVELMAEMADEEASITALDSRESSDPNLNKKFGDKTEVSVSEMLNNLLASNTPFEGFIKALQENIGELGDIKIRLVPNSRPEIRGNAGGYSSLDNTIYINRNANYKGKDGKVDNTILHEIIHAIIANSLNTPKHREELGKIFDEAKEKILKKYGVETFEELPENLRKGRLYGLSNLDEFAAEFFTNSEFVLELNDENIFGKRSSKKSLFNRLVEWIKSLLPKGVTETYKRSGEILEDIILNSGGNIQTNRNLLAGRNSAANTQNLPGPETKINIYAGTGENADLSNFAERPFKLDTVQYDDEGNELPGGYYFDIKVPSGRDTSAGTLGVLSRGEKVTFKTVEGAFQAAKFNYLDFDKEYTKEEVEELKKQGKDHDSLLRKLADASGAEARRIGKSLQGLNTKAWDEDSSTIMKELIKASFQQNPQALQRLLATGNATLTHTQDRGKWGTEFPKLLMEVREELRGQQSSVKYIQEPQSKEITDLYEDNTIIETDDGVKIPIAVGVTIQYPEALGGTKFEIESIDDRRDDQIFTKTYLRDGTYSHVSSWSYGAISGFNNVRVFAPNGEEITNVYRTPEAQKVKETHGTLVNDLGGGEQATAEVQDAVKVAKKGMSFEEALAGQEAFFSKEEQAQIKQGLNGKNLQVMSVSRLTDPAFFSKEIVSFLEKNAKKPLNDPTRVTAIEIWSKHDGLPIKDILDACKKYRVAPMVSFSITGLGGTALEGGVMKYQDILEKVGELIKNGTLNPATTTVRIDPILPGVTNMEDIRKIVETAKSYGIKKFVTSLVQSYGYTEGTPRDRKVVSGINNALATEGKTYDWDKYYGRDRNGKINFKPKQEVIDEIGKVLLELDKDPEITIQTCAFGIKGLKVSACLDPMIIERITGVDVLRKDGTYDRDTSRPECMCYGCHGDFFKGQNKKCYSSCAYCYAAHSGDNKLNYYNEDGTLKDNDYTRTARDFAEGINPSSISSLSQAASINTSQQLVPKARGRMTFDYGTNKRPEVKAVSTLEAIKNGERRATTRYESDGHIDYWKNLNVGDIVEFTGKNGEKVLVRITKPLTKLPSDTNAEEWSKKEGWSVEYFNSKVKPKLGQAWQMEYEYIPQNSSPSSPSQNTIKPSNRVIALENDEVQEVAEPKPLPQSDSFKTALKVTDNPIAKFYQTFTPQQIKDRGSMIASYFSDILDDYILDELDRLNEEIKEYDDILENSSSNRYQKREAQRSKEEATTLKNLLRDPVNGRQYASQKIEDAKTGTKGIKAIIEQVKRKIKDAADRHDGVEKQLWQNTYDYFDDLFNNQASLEIEEQEGIRIVGLQTVETTPDEVAIEEENDGNDETGHIVSGNDGWLFQVRFEDPASSLSKRVRRMLYNIKRSDADRDDLGQERKYSSGQIYATLLSYLAKNMQNPDDFMYVVHNYDELPEVSSPIRIQDEEEFGDRYPNGYPVFPVLEKMSSQYPWVRQIITRLADDYLDKDWNTCIAYPSTYGAMASQFYTNFRKVFIPYAKIQTGTQRDGSDYFGITPLNTEMEARCQKDKLAANFNNGIVMTDTCIYNQDTTINREHADDLKDYILDVTNNGGVEHAYSLYSDLSDSTSETTEAVTKEFNDFTDKVVFLLNSFGISSNRDNVVALLAQEEQGKVLLDMLKDLHYIADLVSKLSDEKAKNFNYFLDLRYTGGEPVWGKFFDGRGMITDESYMQSFYDSASKKTRYSYSADNYLQKTFRGLYNPNLDERRAFIEENFMKYEWFYNHKTNTWRNKWLEHLYNAQDITDTLPYRNINNTSEFKKGETKEVRDYRMWTPDDIWLVQNRSFDSTKPYAFYLAPIFSDSPMSMTVKGPVLSNDEVLDAFVGLVDQEMWRIKYAGEREAAIERGEIKPIANFDVIDGKGGRGKKFCFIPELNDFTFENGEKFTDAITRIRDNKAEDGSTVVYSEEDIANMEKDAIKAIMNQKALEYLRENVGHYDTEHLDTDEFLRGFMNMAYANVAIIQLTTIDLAFYKSDVDFQKRFKEVYAGGIQLNTNSRYGKKTENTILLADDIITSPSYDTIAKIINSNPNLTNKDKEHILSAFTGINVADAQAIRSMHSFRSVMDMMGRWDEKAEEALEHFEKGEWGKEDFDTIFQTIKPFVYTVIDRNDGNGGVIPVPQQHKNSEICALMMYDLITNDLNSPVYKALSKFMETKDSNGEYLIDMIQFESAGKVGNQGLINISFNPDKVMKMLNSDEYDFVAAAPNTLENAETNYKAIKKQMDKKLVGGKITQEEYDKVMQSLRPTEEEIISILEQTALVKDADGNTSINPEVVHTIPFDNYYQAQPTPEHHIDAEATFGSQARNIAVADLPDDFTLTVKVKGSNHTFRGKDAVVDFYYELLDENLIEDFYGDGREGSRNKDGLKGIFSSKESLMEAVTDIVRGNPKYGKDFVDALRTDSDGNFTISPNSPTMFTLMQELVTSLFKNRITKQKINGAALIQAAGIGLDEELRLLKDSKGKIIGAECLMPLTSENFFRPLLKTDEDGRKYFDVNDLPEDLRKAVGYRIPTENKSSMLPLYIKGFTPQQNGSAIILPAEITTLAGSDFDVDKMFVMLSEFYIQNYDMEEARKAWAEEEYLPTSVFSNPSLDDELSDADPEAFREWFKENRNRFRWTSKDERPKIKRVEYNWNLTPKQNGRKARNNMLIQMIYGILTSEAGNQSLLNPQGFDNLKNAAKLNRIIKDPVLKTQLLQTYGDVDDAADAVLGFSLDQKEDFIKKYSSPDAPIYPQTFAHSHAKNMAGSNQIGIYAIQASMAAKYQRADITLKEFQRFTVNGRVIKDVDVSDNGKRLKSCGEMIGASADNGKDPNLSDAGSTSKTAPIIGYMLRLGLTHEEAVLIINQPIMEESGFSADTMERNYNGNIRMLYPGEVDTKTLVKAILDPESIDYSEQQAIDAMCYRILKQAKAMEGLTMISRADSPNGAMQNTFAKARIQQYMVERFNAEMKQPDFPFYPINEVINNTTVDVSKGEENVREALGKQPMAFLHAMYGLGINSLNDLASPYFFMLRDNFDDAIVKPILYNQSSTGRDHLEELVNSIYTDYITYSLSASPLFGEEDNENGEHTSMKSKREYYLNTFPDDFAKILQENEEIRRLLGNILKREIIKDKYTGAVTKRIVLDDVGSLAKGQRDIISRRFDALLSSKEGQDLAKHLLLYAYYDTGLNFSHNSYSTRLSTYFLSQFPAFREILQQLDTPLTEKQQQNFIYQFLITHKDAAFNVDSIKSDKMQINSDSIVVDLSDNNLHRKFTNTILSPDPRMTGVKPYPFISYDGNVYELDADAYARERNVARYYMLEDYPTSSRRPVYNINLSLSQLADEYLGTGEQQESGETSVDENTSPDIAHNSGNENPAVDNTDTQTSDASGEIDFDNLFEAPASESENYENEGKSSLESPFC